MSYLYNNPIQNRVDYLTQQKEMIDSQIKSMQQINVPPININNQITPNNTQTGTFDFNGKWIDNEEQAKSMVVSTTPLLLFDNNNPIFYIKNTDGTIKKFQFEEIENKPQPNMLEDKVNALEGKIDTILNKLQNNKTKDGTITSTDDKQISNRPKQGGKNNG